MLKAKIAFLKDMLEDTIGTIDNETLWMHGAAAEGNLEAENCHAENIGRLEKRKRSIQYIIEKFEEYSDVGFAIILMTPDDKGYLADEPVSTKNRARQNVIFEHGYFIGKLGRERVVALVKGDLELPSDINGILYLGIDPSDSWKLYLAKEMKVAGYNIDLNNLV